MKRLGIAAVGLALVVGIVVGGMVGNPFDGKASASAAAVGGRLIELGTQTVSEGLYFESPLVDVSDCAELRAMAQGSDVGGDLSLFDRNIHTSPDGVVRVQGPPPQDTACAYGDGVVRRPTCAGVIPGPHRYVSLRVLNTDGAMDITVWLWCATTTSPTYAVGGIAELPALAGPTGASGMGGVTYAVLAGAAAGVLAFAVLATLYARRWRVR